MTVKIRKLEQLTKGNICKIPSKIFKSHNLSTQQRYHFHAGQLSEYIDISTHDEPNDIIYLSNDLIEKLHLFKDITLNIWRKDNHIYLGPVVGVFVNLRYLSNIIRNKPSERARRLFEANYEANCLLYFFSIEDINWIDKTIKGYIFEPSSEQYISYWLPLPNVVYDRGVNFLSNEKPLVKHIRTQFKYYKNVHFINNKEHLSKWHTYNRLAKYNDIRYYLPETIRYKNFNDVKNMLVKYDFIFLKSFYGSRGREVLSIKKTDSGYDILFYNKGIQEKTFSFIDDAKKFIEDFICNKKFIIQQGIHLFKYLKRNIDLRLLLEKNEFGKWDVIFNHVRIGPPNSTITNYSVGGDIIDYSSLYLNIQSKNIATPLPTDSEIRNTTIYIAICIEKEFGQAGELGIDIAIDEKGNLWLLEANTKPYKNPIKGIENTDGIIAQFLSILKYAQYLSKLD